jgi:hypothetical protein
VLNATYTDGDLVDGWTPTRLGVVNQALAEWEAVFANVNETVDVEVTFANAGTGGYIGQWSSLGTTISWYGQDNPAPGTTPVRPWDVDTLNAGAGTGARSTMIHTIRFNAALMNTGLANYLWFDPDPTSGPVEFKVWDALSVARHEIGHMLGVVDGVYMDDYYATDVFNWDTDVTGSTFDAGGLNLPLEAEDNISHFADLGVTTDDLMNAALANGQRREISDNDIDALAVAYGYDLIPEPASLTLMATSVVLLLRRRRRAA